MKGLGLGTFRFFLAFLVAISHLWENMLHGPAAYSVWGFFVLSGFLMTLVLSKKYGIDRSGLKKYAFNRFLRIYPSYIVGCIFGIIVLVLFQGDDTTVLNPSFRFPQTLTDYIHNFFMIPLPTQGLLVPVAGALFTEMWAYMLMPFSAKSRSAAWLGFLITAFTNIHYGFSVETFGERYSFFTPAIVGFFVGSLCFHYFEVLKRFAMPKISLMVWCLHAVLWWVDISYPWTYGIYVSLFCSAWVVISLFPIKTKDSDKLLGDMSYLVYLLHTTVGMCVYQYFEQRSFSFFCVAFTGTIILSYLMVVCFERPLQHRFKIKL